MDTSCKMKKKTGVEKENSKMNTDSSEDSISLIMILILLFILLRKKASNITFLR